MMCLIIILYTIQPYGRNYFCDIFTKLSKGKVVLRINTKFVEIWNFDIGQCEIKIQLNKMRYVKELDNKQLALIGDGGIQLINVKYSLYIIVYKIPLYLYYIADSLYSSLNSPFLFCKSFSGVSYSTISPFANTNILS